MASSKKYEECLYRYRLLHPIKQVDNDPPKLHPTMPSCAGNALRMDGIMNENKTLLQRLCFIYRTSGTLDCYPPKCTYSTNYSDRLRKMIEIEQKNIDILCQIHQVNPEVPTVKFCNKDWKRLLTELIKNSKYPFQFAGCDRDWLPLPSLYTLTSEEENASRDRAFMEFTSSQGRFLGRIEFELFKDKAPKTCENFLAFVTGKAPNGLSYLNSKFYQILPDYYVMAGDILKGNGTGVVSVDGETSLPDEKNNLSHSEPGNVYFHECTITSKSIARSAIFKPQFLGNGDRYDKNKLHQIDRTCKDLQYLLYAFSSYLSPFPRNLSLKMFERAMGILCTPGTRPDSVDSKFMVTTKPLTVIDDRSTVFGRVIQGLEVLNGINACGSKPSGKVTIDVIITKCGKLPKKKKPTN